MASLLGFVETAVTIPVVLFEPVLSTGSQRA